MTGEIMTFRALLEKSSDADLLREMIGLTAQRLMIAGANYVFDRETVVGRIWPRSIASCGVRVRLTTPLGVAAQSALFV